MGNFDNAMDIIINVSGLLIPLLMLGLIVACMKKKVPVYDAFVEGAGQGIKSVFEVAPYIIAMTTLVSLLRASGIEQLLVRAFSPLGRLGFPAAVLPMALIRPLSGSAALAMLQDIIVKYGPDSYEGFVAGTLMGSTETVFYTVALYFGAAGVTRPRYTIPAALIACAAGTAASAWICSLFI